MNEVIASILDAESRAEEIAKQSAEKAVGIRRAADEECEKIKNGAVAVFKIHRNSALLGAEKQAQAEYDEILERGKLESEKLYNAAADKFDEFADDVLKGIIG